MRDAAAALRDAGRDGDRAALLLVYVRALNRPPARRMEARAVALDVEGARAVDGLTRPTAPADQNAKIIGS